MARRALITGITGQDGSYLAELLLEKDYEVHGLVRRASTKNYERIEHILNQITLHEGDLVDESSLIKVIKEIEPDEIYNLAAQSFVPTSFRAPVYTAEVNALGVTRLLEAIRLINPKIKFYQASTSEMFGNIPQRSQNEKTPFYPRSPYAIAKLYAYWITVNYREAYGLFAANGLIFNHESPRRGLEFVTRKISYGVAKIKLGLANELRLGNLDARRDWGYAGDAVKAIWLIMQQEEPDDYIIATGVSHSVKEFAQAAFAHVGLNWEDYVVVDPSLFRPAETDYLLGDPTKAKRKLGWEPEVSFEELVAMMVDADIELLKKKPELAKVEV